MYLRERMPGPTLDDVLATVSAELRRRVGMAGSANPWLAAGGFVLALAACWTPFVLLAILVL